MTVEYSGANHTVDCLAAMVDVAFLDAGEAVVLWAVLETVLSGSAVELAVREAPAGMDLRALVGTTRRMTATIRSPPQHVLMLLAASVPLR